MKLKGIKLGFTLIELLVVITIIGILATGAVGVYSSQIKKARDATRASDMSELRGALEQTFSEISEFPRNVDKQTAGADCDDLPSSTTSIACVVQLGYLDRLPTDPKKGLQGFSGSMLHYSYIGFTVDSIDFQGYELSSGVETPTYYKKATDDGGNDDIRLEFGMVGRGKNTDYAYNTSSAGSCGFISGTSGAIEVSGECTTQ